MWRVTQEVGEIRTWVQGRGGWPCRLLDGRIALNFPGERCRGLEIGWDEFGPNFHAGRCVCVYDDSAGAARWFLGTAQEAHHFGAEAPGRRMQQREAR